MPLSRIEPKRGTIIILLLFFVALCMTLIPLPWWLKHFNPEWTALVLIYWCLAVPRRVGMIAAMILGLMIDALKGNLFGQHALGLVVISYLVLSFYQRIRISPVFQQALTIMGLLFIYQLLLFWFDGISRTTQDSSFPIQSARDWRYWLASVGGFVVWPWLYFLLRALRRRYKIK